MPELHCSACDALVPAGADRCPGCGLQLTVQAQLAIYTYRRRWPIWFILVSSIAIFVVIANIIDRFYDARQNTAVAQQTADQANHLAFEKELKAISTPSAFQARCGKAAKVEHLGAPTYVRGTTRLVYHVSRSEDVRVYLNNDGGTLGFDTVLYGKRYIQSGPIGSQDKHLLAEIGCHIP